HEDWHELSDVAELGDDREAVLARQHHVEDDEIEGAADPPGQPLERRLAGLDYLDVVSFGLEVESNPLGEMLFVLDDQHTRGVHASAAFGSSSVKVLPRPVPSLSAKARPPCLRATDRTMKRPRPLPFARTATPVGMR